MKLLCLISVFTALSFSSLAEISLSEHIKLNEKRSLERIISDRYIRILTSRNIFDYYTHKGRTKGIQYEMARLFVDQLNQKYVKGDGKIKISFELIPVDYDQLIPMLRKGYGDIIATGLTSTVKREKLVSFSVPYRHVDEVIVTRKENHNKGWANKVFSVRKSSSYYESLLKKKKILSIKLVTEELHEESIMELISFGAINYTVSDSYLAKMGVSFYDNLTILKERPFGRNVGISWAVRKEDKELLSEINQFIPSVRKGSLLGNLLDRKYFSDLNKIKTADFDLKKSIISKHDRIFKKYARIYDFDWRLLVALAYQESRLDPLAHNKWGAIGIMQIKQSTANEPYVNIKEIKGIENLENNIHAGVRYLSWIKKTYFDKYKNLSEKERVRLTIASYNAGPTRVLNAIKHSQKRHRSSSKWFREVELSMLEMGFSEPVQYVTEINKRYITYILLGIK